MRNKISTCKTKKSLINVVAAIFFAMVLMFALGTTVRASSTGEFIYLADPMALVVSTGAGDGSGIGFFGVEYEDISGNLHTQYIFPHDGDYSKGNALIKYYSMLMDTNRQQSIKELGYTYSAWSDDEQIEVLGAYTENIFFFRPVHKVAAIKNIYIYTDLTAGNSKSWTCTELSVYGIDEFYGSQMYGYVSEQFYTGFSGDLMARLEGGSKTFSTAADTIYKLSPDSKQYTLNTTIVPSENYKNSTDTEYAFKIDIADVYGAGIETFTNSSRLTIKKMSLPEVLNLQVVYVCNDGHRQVVNFPVITSAIANAADKCTGAVTLVDFAGQGESIVTVGNLPDFKALESVKLTYGPDSALAESGMIELSANANRTVKANSIKEKADTISISGISFYKIGEENSTVSYRVQNDTILVPEISGEPLFYYTADSYRGVELGVNSSMSFAMKEYTSGARLSPVDNQKKYLVVIDTDNVATSAGKRIIPDITMQLSYTSTSGQEVETATYRLKELAKEYYGFTPNTEGEDCSYSMNVYVGERLYALVSLNDVETFTAVSFGLSNQFEEWQLSNFAIYKVDDMSPRRAEWINGSKDFFGQSAKMYYYREFSGSRELMKSAEIYNAPINMFIQNTDKQKVDFNSKNVIEVETSFDWMAEDKYRLDYKKASVGQLGFYNAQVNYQVDVKVADNSTNTMEDGDSGSKNFFYFQLIFENGNSAIVQANQMLEADGFLTGQIATFHVATNYDYGELVSVRVIPDDFSSKADPYDKLNVDYINVTKKAKSGYASVWTVSNVGWIGIDYKDDGEEANISAETGRAMEDLAYTYDVTGSSAGVELQFAITTGAYPEESSGKQFVGSVTADVGYMDSNGGYRTVSFDVVQAMYNYANKTAEYTSGNGKRQSDSSFMFLENRTNRFTYFINDISELVDIRLYVYSDGGGVLNIASVSAALVVEEGPLSINTWGEYQKDSTLFPLTRNANPISAFQVGKGDSVNSNIGFRASERGMLAGLVNGTWPYTVNPDMSINEDYLNIFVYPENTITSMPDITLQATMDYSDSYGQGYRIQNELSYRVSDSGAGYYSVEEVRASDLEAIKEIKIERVDGADDLEIGTVIIQKIRDGQIIQTGKYDMGGINASIAPSETTAAAPEDTGERQVVTLSFAEDMDKKILEEEVADVAVALIYTSVYDPSGTEYISPYVYLTADEINSIAGGDSGQFAFSVSNVDRITGISVAATGGLAIKTDCAVVTTYKAINGVLKLEDWYSVCEGAEIANGSASFAVTTKDTASANTLLPITLTLTTGVESGQNTGTDAPIRLVMEYTGFDGTSHTKTISDIRKYTVSGDYSTNSEAVVELLLPNIKEISLLTFEPYDSEESHTESWKLGTVSINYGIGDSVKKAQISLTDENAFAYEGAPARVVLKKVVVKLHYKEDETTQTIQNASGGCIREAGEALNFWVETENSTAKSVITVYEVIDDSRRDVTEKYLSDVTDSKEKIFMVPVEDIISDTKYEIVVTSEEMPEFNAVLTVVVRATTSSEEEVESTP